MVEIAICFFGITRSLPRTIRSIEQKVVRAAEKHGRVRNYCHFFTPEEIRNTRSGEVVKVKAGDHFLLNPTATVLEKPMNLNECIEFNSLTQHGDYWDDDFGSLSNLYHQLISLEKVTKLALENPADIYIFARPDLEYVDSLLVPILRARMERGRNTVFVPHWQGWGGVNDRFAISASSAAAKAYGERRKFALRYCEQNARPLHSESLLSFAMNQEGIEVKKIATRAIRVRANGRHVEEDFTHSLQRKFVRNLNRALRPFR